MEKDKFTYDTKGYLNAVKWLKKVKKWESVSKGGLSVDGLSIVNEANSIYKTLTTSPPNA
jgi:hypothetical protein